MGSDAQPTFRTPLILLAAVDLAILGARLWPWQDAMNLPGNGTAALDPAISLAAYIGLSFWISNTRSASARKSLLSSAMLGLIGGLLLAAQIFLTTRPAGESGSNPATIEMGLMGAAAVICGIAGWRAARAGHSPGFSMVCAGWCAMVSCLIATTSILAEAYFAVGPAETADPWKQYEGLAIGSPATQALVHSLNTIAGYLLIGPIIGSIVGVVFAQFGSKKKS